MLAEPTGAAASILALGFLLGLRHATDADHVVAVTTIVSRHRRLSASALVGVLWGAGHTLSLMTVGGAIVLFRLVIPTRLGLGMDLAVAAMLVGLGAANLTRLSPPAATREAAQRELEGKPRVSQPIAAVGVRPLIVGLVHGLAGSAASALLVLSEIADPGWAIVYLAIFGLGTVAGMTILTTAVALPFAGSRRRLDAANTGLARITGLASVAFGMLIAYQLIVVQGMFSPHPVWNPS